MRHRTATYLAAAWAIASAVARTPHQRPDTPGASVFTGASETLRLSGIDAGINTSGRYQAIRPRVLAMEPRHRRRRHLAAARQPRRRRGQRRRGHRNRLPGGRLGQRQPATRLRRGAARAIWIAGAQKVVPDLSTALRRVGDHALTLENARAQQAYGQPSAINRLLILNAEPHPGRSTVLLLGEPIGF